MAVCRKNCTKSRLPVAIITCVYVLCAMIDTAEGGGKLRHHHRHGVPASDDDDVYVSQLEKSAFDDGSKTPRPRPIVSCPNCLYKTTGGGDTGGEAPHDTDTDNLRLEAIKRQILSKLGLRHKPNVTHSLPREVIMETLFRAEDSDDFFTNIVDGGNNPDPSTTSTRSSPFETVDVDDFYGRTSEIISFADQGFMVNGNRLLEFRVSAEPGQAGHEFTVRAATLWLKADVRHPRTSKCKSTDIYVFKFISNLSHSVRINSQEFNNLAKDPVVVSLDETKGGWQKVDVTEIVRAWLRGSSGKTLRLLVDCSCCDNWHIHLFNPPETDSRPFLVIHTDPNTAKRVRRRALDCSVDSGNQCCKQRFYVSFKQLGWDDWVIAPQGYYANYCRGDCGHHRTPDMYVTYHTHVIEEVRKTHHLSGMQPCCAPLKFSSMSLIYFGPDSNIIKRDLPKMVVDECGCP